MKIQAELSVLSFLQEKRNVNTIKKAISKKEKLIYSEGLFMPFLTTVFYQALHQANEGSDFRQRHKGLTIKWELLVFFVEYRFYSPGISRR